LVFFLHWSLFSPFFEEKYLPYDSFRQSATAPIDDCSHRGSPYTNTGASFLFAFPWLAGNQRQIASVAPFHAVEASGGGRLSSPTLAKEKTTPPPQASASVAPRGPPFVRKLAKQATRAWASLHAPKQVVHVRPPPRCPTLLAPALPSPPLLRFTIPTLPGPTMAQQPPNGGSMCHERGPQHTGFLVSKCAHWCR
jgi:hypothetical protein